MKNFYHSTTRKLITIFGSIFNEMYIDMDSKKPPYKIPLHFATREKFMTILTENPDPYSASAAKQYVWLAFALVGMNYAAERATCNVQKMRSSARDNKYMYNRVPYDLNFELYISSKQLEHSFMILEQIIPIFKPDFNVKINEIDGFSLNTDISISLDSIQPELEVQGAMTDQRNIFWTLSFTMKAWYYPRIDRTNQIKQAIVNILEKDDYPNSDPDNFLSKFTTTVNPLSANKEDPHTIDEDYRENV